MSSKKLFALLFVFLALGAQAQLTPQAIPLSSGACKLDGTQGCGGGGGSGTGLPGSLAAAPDLAAAPTAGTLPAATYYYVVQGRALLYPSGFTNLSTEASCELAAPGGCSLSIDPGINQLSPIYVYRGTAPGAENKRAVIYSWPDTTWVDDGSVSFGDASPTADGTAFGWGLNAVSQSGSLWMLDVQVLRLNGSSGGQPYSCYEDYGGTVYYARGAPGEKDVVQVCAKNASNVWAWRTIY